MRLPILTCTWCLTLMSSASALQLPPEPPASSVLTVSGKGSVLVFPYFDLVRKVIPDDGAGGNHDDAPGGTTTVKTKTQIRISNTADDPVAVHLLYHCGVRNPPNRPVPYRATCSSENRTIYLTGRETWVADVEDFFQPQCRQGYIVAYAADAIYYNREILWNHLTGSYRIIKPRPKRGMAEQAIAFEGLEVNGDGVLNFNGVEFANLAAAHWSDFRATEFKPLRGAELILLTLDVYSGGPNFPTRVLVNYWNERGDPLSAGHEFWCWDKVRLDHISNNFKAGNLGSIQGLLRVKAVSNNIPEDPNPTHAVIGALRDIDSGFNMLRNLHRDKGVAAATYIGDAALTP